MSSYSSHFPIKMGTKHAKTEDGQFNYHVLTVLVCHAQLIIVNNISTKVTVTAQKSNPSVLCVT